MKKAYQNMAVSETDSRSIPAHLTVREKYAEMKHGGWMAKEKKRCRFLSGPVKSRRLGKSLGVDLVPFKTCPYDCIYCELGRTTNKTATPGNYLPTGEIIREIRERLHAIPPPEYITLAGAGEPTLHSRIGEVIKEIKKTTDVPVALLTSGALFWMKEVTESVLGADLILPSLDAGDAETFQKINRPHRDIPFGKMLDGLSDLRKSYHGPIWLEVFFVGGVNTSEADVLRMRKCALSVAPDRIQLNTVDRMTAEPFVQAVPEEDMKKIASLFGSLCEVIGCQE
jgi:wyosine [tRNA(Phe)-imidazoG37] synthetase (radical SAM superfamily)